MENDLTITQLVNDTNLLAIDLWRNRRYGEACDLLSNLMKTQPGMTPLEEIRTRNNWAMCERERGHYKRALKIHLDGAALVDKCADHTYRGKFHNGLALTYQHLGDSESALLEFTAATVCYEEAGESRLRADVENNIAVLLVDGGHIEGASEHLALALGASADPAVAAQVNDTAARIALAMGDNDRALELSLLASLVMLRLDEPGILSKCLPTLVRAARIWGRAADAEQIQEALEACDWNVTRAALRLGFNTRQALQQLLKRKFPEINAERVRRNT